MGTISHSFFNKLAPKPRNFVLRKELLYYSKQPHSPHYEGISIDLDCHETNASSLLALISLMNNIPHLITVYVLSELILGVGVPVGLCTNVYVR